MTSFDDAISYLKVDYLVHKNTPDRLTDPIKKLPIIAYLDDDE